METAAERAEAARRRKRDSEMGEVNLDLQRGLKTCPCNSIKPAPRVLIRGTPMNALVLSQGMVYLGRAHKDKNERFTRC